MTDTNQNVDLFHLDINQLQPNPLQPRGVITNDSLADLIDSVRIHGVLEPLVAANTPAGYQIIAGERRWRAAKLAGVEKIPVYVKKTSPKGMLEMAIVENVQRTDLNPIDRAKAFERLMNEFGFTNGQIAERVSKSPAYVSNTLKLLTLPDAVTDGILDEQISEGHARAISSIDNKTDMIEAFRTIVKEKGSVRRAEELSRRYKNQSENNELKRKASPLNLLLNERLDQIQNDLNTSFGEKTKVSVKQSSVQAKVNFVFKGTPEETNKKIELLHEALNKVSVE